MHLKIPANTKICSQSSNSTPAPKCARSGFWTNFPHSK